MTRTNVCLRCHQMASSLPGSQVRGLVGAFRPGHVFHFVRRGGSISLCCLVGRDGRRAGYFRARMSKPEMAGALSRAVDWKMAIITAQDVANYFLQKASKDKELISNLKLQKLIYYSQGLHLVIYNKPLFPEIIEAWTYGPVVRDLYHKYKHLGSQGIPPDEDFIPSKISVEKRKLLDEIYRVFGQYSAFRLAEISHSDKCWKDAKTRSEISHESMKIELRKYLKNG